MGWRPGRGAPHFPDVGRPGRGAPHFPDGGAADQRCSSPPRWGGGWVEVLLTSQTGRWLGRGAPHFPDSGGPGRGSPHIPNGVAGWRRSSLPRWGGSQAEVLLTSQMVVGWAEMLLTSQTGQRPGRGAPHFPDGAAAGQRCSSHPRGGSGWAEALLTSQMLAIVAMPVADRSSKDQEVLAKAVVHPPPPCPLHWEVTTTGTACAPAPPGFCLGVDGNRHLQEMGVWEEN
nr:uncharacterized protein LOC129473147 [Symphalangus syndactylus]